MLSKDFVHTLPPEMMMQYDAVRCSMMQYDAIYTILKIYHIYNIYKYGNRTVLLFLRGTCSVVGCPAFASDSVSLAGSTGCSQLKAMSCTEEEGNSKCLQKSCHNK